MSEARAAADPLRQAGPLVSGHQLPAVLIERDLHLAACPGSGKTRTAAVRVARLAEDGIRVAMCSYTNTGVDELRQTLAHEVGHTLGPQHFCGTLHQFLLRYVLHPFGQLVLGCTGSPRILGPDASAWPSIVFDRPTIRLGLHRFQFRPDGALCIRNRDAKFPYDSATAVAMRGERARREKLRLARDRGWVSTDDAMYWALRVLREHPWAATAVTQRFDEILVDEAQDTSELQLACLRELHLTGTLSSLTLVGDVDQSISSYNGAHPDGCEELAQDRGLHRVVLRENRRCSQAICDVTTPLHSRAAPDAATGLDRDCPWPPELVLYPVDDPAAVVDRFSKRLADLGENPDEAAVLTRTNELAAAINGSTCPNGVNKKALAIARLVHTQRRGATLGRRDLDWLDRALAVVAWDREDLTAEPADTRWALRRASMTLLATAPPLDTDLGAWTTALRGPMADAVALLADQPAHKIGPWLRVTSAMNGHPVADLLAHSSPALQARTVHDVKGESRSSILLVVGKASRLRNPAGLLGSALAGHPVAPEDAEETRISYVALTRARRLCRVALPDNTPANIVDQFTTSGFDRRDS
jgi:DNA helicase II / ATP-dependent DNA helicase PcrA